MNKSDVPRVSVEETRRRVDAGKAMLVCGYEPDEKFRKFHLEGALSLHQFRTKLPTLNENQEIIFYCA